MKEYATHLDHLRNEGNPEGQTEYGLLCERIENDFYRDHGFWASDEYVEETAIDRLERKKYLLEMDREMDENE